MLRLLAVALLCLLPTVANAACDEDSAIATGEYAAILRESQTSLQKEVAVLRVRLMRAEERAQKAEQKAAGLAADLAKQAPKPAPQEP